MSRTAVIIIAGLVLLGVFLEAGYTVGEELPVLLLIFAVPAVPALGVRLYAARTA